MDAFSEVLNGVKLKGALFFSGEFSAPWALASPAALSLAPVLSPGALHLIMYHFVVEGIARARMINGTELQLTGGDIVVFPHGDAHELGSGCDTSLVDNASLLKKIAARDLTPMFAGGGGRSTRFVCGFLVCDPLLCRPILDALPPIFKVNVRTDPRGQWFESTLLHLVAEAESDRAGSEAMMAKLSEALFVDTLRRYFSTLTGYRVGWLAAATDQQLSKSLALMHRRVEYPWTIAELAEAVGLSRSALQDRFSRYFSQPPMAYLTRWRLQLAAQALTTTAKGVAEIAGEVGYESEAAFNRAFKRSFGITPARYRRERRSGADAT